MAVTRASWAKSLLAALNCPTTDSNVAIIVGWEMAEGGAGPQFGVAGNTCAYNPLNTTQTEPGSIGQPGNVPPVQAYVNWAQGLDATVTTLNNGNYPTILSMLQSGTASPSTAAATIDGSPWGTKDLTVALISGANTTESGDPITTVVGGGVYGLGGTGTSSNTPIDSLWVVGDASNPDQDYWTTINQYAQDAQIYAFSDGEALYFADGIKLMGQTPQAFISAMDPAVISASLTYDNTSFSYTHTHVAKGNAIIRRAALAKVTSPTQVTLRVVCDIDKFRGGDTVYLDLFGPADGLWLIGERRRSVFQPYSDLTLVQAMQPINANSGLALGPQYETGPNATKTGSGTVYVAMDSEVSTITNKTYPYVWGGGHAQAGTPSTGDPPGPGANGTNVGFDCSGFVGAVLASGGLWKLGSSVPAVEGIISKLQQNGRLAAGAGSGVPEVTIFTAFGGDHIYMRFNSGQGEVYAAAQQPGIPVGWYSNGGIIPGSVAYHIPASILGQSASAIAGTS